MNKIIHFDIPADDVDRAEEFYKKTFGWKIEGWGGPMDYRLVSTGTEKENALGGGMGKRNSPDDIITLTIGVDSVDDFSKKIEDNGGKIIVPKKPITGEGYYAMCKDTEGNVFSIMEEDSEAR